MYISSLKKKKKREKTIGDNKMEFGQHEIQSSKLLVARGGVGIGIVRP
jgi:hypothetical protein